MSQEQRNGTEPRSYAVVWRERRGPVLAGKLELCAESVRLEGATRSGRAAAMEIPYASISEVRIGRAPEERIDGRPSVVLECAGNGAVTLAGATGVGIVHELADRLTGLAPASTR